MWKIKYISAENFMSFNKIELTFEDKCYVVRGFNKDNSAQESNGSGKSSLVDIAPIAILGYSLTGRNVKDCVNWNLEAKYFEVQLFMENETHGLNCFITRKVYSGSKGQELSILINDEVPSELPSKKGVVNGVDVKEGNTYILREILNITEDDLLNYYFISKSNYAPFLEVNTDRKLEVIGRFSRADRVDLVINKLEENVKEVNADILAVEHSISKANGHIEALQQTLLESAMEQFETDKATEIERISSEIEQIYASYDIVANELEKERVELAELEKDPIEDLKTKVSSQQEVISVLQKELKDAGNEISKEEQRLSKLQAILKEAIECPKCKHQFNLAGEAIPSNDDLLNLQAYINIFKENKITIKGKIEAEEKVLQLIYAEKKAQDTLLININSHKRKLQSLLDEQESIATRLFNSDERLQTAKSKTFEDQSESIKTQIVDKERELESIKARLQELHEENMNIKQWIDNFNDFKFTLSNKPIENICALVNQYLQLNGSDLNLLIEGFKRLRSGELRQSLTPIIYRNWMNPQPFVQFSEGEKARLNLTVDLSFQQLINSTSKFGGLDFYQNDELLNPLDSLGVSNAAKAFNQLNKTILLVSHSGADMVYENTIVVQKENKVSSLA